MRETRDDLDDEVDALVARGDAVQVHRVVDRRVPRDDGAHLQRR